MLAPGDLVAFFTDGVVEAPDPGGNEFGEERLVEILSRHRDESLDLVLDVIEREVDRWRGGAPPHDDLTLVLVRAV